MSALAWLIVVLALLAVFYVGYRLGRMTQRISHRFSNKETA